MDPYLRAAEKFPKVKNQAKERRAARRQKEEKVIKEDKPAPKK